MSRQSRHLTDAELASIARTTLEHYDNNAARFFEGTKDHDVEQNISALLSWIPSPPPCSILDFGCGPGRDLVRFAALGHEPVGLDGSAAFVDLARRESGCEVLLQNFLSLELPPARFDGIFANASLFHVPRQVLHGVLVELHTTLKPGGILFASNPRGDNQEGWNDTRYGCFHDLDQWRLYVRAAGFRELQHYYRPPGKPRHQQPWLATVWQKI